MSLTIGIVSYSLTKEHKAMTQAAIESYKGLCDELLVVENGGNAYFDADIFIQYKHNQGYTKAANTVLKNATSEYIAVVNNDTTLESGNLHDLCIPGTVTSPNIFPISPEGFSGSFFVVPKTVLLVSGFLNEAMVNRYSDTDYLNRLIRLNIPIQKVETVRINHKVNQTISVTVTNDQDGEVYRKL